MGEGRGGTSLMGSLCCLTPGNSDGHRLRVSGLLTVFALSYSGSLLPTAELTDGQQVYFRSEKKKQKKKPTHTHKNPDPCQGD